jgi:hypothetical protein
MATLILKVYPSEIILRIYRKIRDKMEVIRHGNIRL